MSYFVASEGALETGAAVVARKQPNRRFAALTLAALSRRLLGTSSTVALGLVLATSTPSRATDWTGATSTDWFTAANWSAGVPTSAVDANIDTVAPHATVVGTAGAKAFRVTVGNSGTGTLTIQNGGKVSNADGFLGANAGSTGTATVDGAGSTWTNSGTLFVGNSGAGTLTIQNGGKVSNVFGLISANAGSTGTVTVDGAGSAWTNSGDLYAGVADIGTVTIRNGGAVSNVSGYLGINAGSTGTATVDGAGSTWTNSGTLNVGFSSTGTLTIQNGGAVSNVDGLLGYFAGSTGTVTVDGAGSTWTNSGGVAVGLSGAGTLTIQNGGTVSYVAGYLGYNAGSTGTVTVDGAGSAWTNSGGLTVGNAGTGTLTIANGGAVSAAAGMTIANLAGSTGTLNIGAASGQAAAAPGTLTTPSVAFGAGTGGIVFNHTASNYTFDPTISGAGSVSVENGTTILTATNTYSGPTTVNGGVLQLGNGGTTGSILGNVLNNATLAFNRSNAYQFDSAISGTGGVQQNGVGTTTLTAANTYTGGTTINGGILNAGSAGALGTTGTISFTGGTLQYSAANTTDYSSRFSNAANQAYHIDTNGQTVTVQTALTSVGGTFTKDGTGTLSFSGANTYSGATTINAGTLMGAATNTFSATSATTINTGGTLDLGFLGQTINAVSLSGGTLANGSLSGAVSSGGGTVSSIGGTATLTANSGTTTVSGTNTYTGATTVNGGTLAVNGSIANSAVTVNAGGTLGGNGTVGNTTINGGALAPGNSIGTLTVGGNLAFGAGGIYRVEVSPSAADRANVTGIASLTGGTVQTTFLPGTYVGKSYTILSAAGGLGGTTFSGVSGGMPGFNVGLSYTPSDVLLNLTASLGAGTSLPGNPQAVASTLNNFFNNGGALPPGFVALFGLTGSNLSAALSQTSGETATGSQQTTFNAMGMFMGLLTDPFIDGRGDPVSAGSSTGASAYAWQDRPRSGATRDANAMFTKAPIAADPFAQRWSVWAAGYGGSQTTDGNATLGTNNTTSRIAGGVVGADYRISPYTLAGFALAGGGTNFSIANNLGSGRSDLFQAGAFVRHNAGAAYFSGALAYGWQDITTNRTVTVAGIDQLRAEFNANAFSGRVEGGYRFVSPWMGGVGITPYAAGQFTTFDLPAYAEQALVGANTFALAYGAKSVTDTRSELGLRSDKSFAMQDGIFTLRGRVAWAHDFNPDRNIAATFQTLPGASFVVNGAAQAHDAALTTASAEMKWLNGFSLAATFEGEFSDVTDSYAGKGVVRYAW